MGVLLCHAARRFDGISLKVAVVLAFTVKLVGYIMCPVLILRVPIASFLFSTGECKRPSLRDVARWDSSMRPDDIREQVSSMQTCFWYINFFLLFFLWQQTANIQHTSDDKLRLMH